MSAKLRGRRRRSRIIISSNLDVVCAVEQNVGGLYVSVELLLGVNRVQTLQSLLLLSLLLLLSVIIIIAYTATVRITTTKRTQQQAMPTTVHSYNSRS